MTYNHLCSRFDLPSRHRLMLGLSMTFGLLALTGCKASLPAVPATAAQDAGRASTNTEEIRMWMTVGERRFAINLADNETARASRLIRR